MPRHPGGWRHRFVMNIRLTEPEDRAIEVLAQRHKMTRSSLVRWLVTKETRRLAKLDERAGGNVVTAPPKDPPCTD